MHGIKISTPLTCEIKRVPLTTSKSTDILVHVVRNANSTPCKCSLEEFENLRSLLIESAFFFNVHV